MPSVKDAAEPTTLIERAAKANRTALRASVESLAIRSRARTLRAEHRRAALAPRPRAGRTLPNSARMAHEGRTHGTGCFFELRGVVSGTSVRAMLTSYGLECDPLLRAHAELVVALGETFPYGEHGVVTASLDGSPAQILLTLMRSMKVTGLQLCVCP